MSAQVDDAGARRAREHPVSAEAALEAAEEKLLRDRRAFARKLLGLVAAELTRQHPEAARLEVHADPYRQRWSVLALRDGDGDVVRPDAGRVVVARETAEDPLGEPVTVATRDVDELLRRALEVYEGPPERLLGVDAEGGLFLDLRGGR